MTRLATLPRLDCPDDLRTLTDLTAARIGLARSGSSLSTSELLAFDLDHARARDAVHLPFDVPAIEQALRVRGLDSMALQSAALDRACYLQRPDLGRRLSSAGRAALQTHRQSQASPRSATDAADPDHASSRTLAPDVAVIVADGLSARAIHDNAVPFLDAWLPLARSQGWRLATTVVASQARVALADEIGAALHARLSVILIGERPGLSAADSMGIYLTYQPRPGRNDAERNCISNIRTGGLAYAEAAQLLTGLIAGAFRQGLSGVGLKDDRTLINPRALS